MKKKIKDKQLEKGSVVKSIWSHIEIGDKVRYKGQIVEVMRKNMLDKMYCLKDTDQLYKNNKLFAEKINNNWRLLNE